RDSGPRLAGAGFAIRGIRPSSAAHGDPGTQRRTRTHPDRTASAPRALLREFSNEQTRRVLQARPPGTPHDDSAVSPLPMRKIPRETAAEALEELPVQPWSPDQWLANHS